jgi:hypothetical protein
MSFLVDRTEAASQAYRIFTPDILASFAFRLDEMFPSRAWYKVTMATPQLVRDLGGIRIDTRSWPLIIWEMPSADGVSATATAQAFGYLKELWQTRAPGERVFQLTDLSRALGATAASRRFAADFMKENEALIVEATLGGATVITSPIMRGVITAVFWLKASPVPTRIVATREDGLRHGLDLLEAHRSPLPTHLQALRKELRIKATG